jgi:hypothetical protein
VGRNLGDASGTGLASSNLRTFSAVRTHANLGLLEHTVLDITKIVARYESNTLLLERISRGYHDLTSISHSTSGSASLYV